METWVKGKNNWKNENPTEVKTRDEKYEKLTALTQRMWREIDQWRDKGKISKNDFFLW